MADWFVHTRRRAGAADKVEKDPKTRRSHHEMSKLSSSTATRVALVVVVTWAFFAFVLDPPFAAYWMLMNGAILVSAHIICIDTRASRVVPRQEAFNGSWTRNRTKLKRSVWCLVLLALCANLFAMSVLREFEINMEHYYHHIPRIPLDAKEDIQFFQIYNPELRYMSCIEAIHDHLNNHQHVAQRYEVDPKFDPWLADVLRFDFLLQFWHQLDQEEPIDGSKIICIAESDVVFQEAYFAKILREQKPLELAHIQHYKAHHSLEAFNIGILCSSSEASWWTRRWVQLMRFLHSRRYRRLVYFDLLFKFVRGRLVFIWDQHHGCTEYYPHCQYIHFTRPKALGIKTAIQAIQQFEDS